MTNDNTKSTGANVLTWAMIAGAALLFLEVTWSPAMQIGPAKTATVQAVSATATQPDRLARN